MASSCKRTIETLTVAEGIGRAMKTTLALSNVWLNGIDLRDRDKASQNMPGLTCLHDVTFERHRFSYLCEICSLRNLYRFEADSHPSSVFVLAVDEASSGCFSHDFQLLERRLQLQGNGVEKSHISIKRMITRQRCNYSLLCFD